MGCDIHSLFERRNPDGTWESVLDTNPTPDDLERHTWACADARDMDLPDPLMYKTYWDRDYLVFALLAGVRNYWGVTPIAPPKRGVPADASGEYLRLVEQWEGDGHNHTWVSLEEVFDNTWHTRTIKGDSHIPDGTTYLSLAVGFMALAWDVLQEQKVHPRDLRLVMFFDN